MENTSPQPKQMRLYNQRAERLYLNDQELQRFLAVANQAEPKIRQFALTLAYTGCRISEARELRYGALQLEARIASIRSLKKRNLHLVREVPMPVELVRTFEGVIGLDHALIWNEFGRLIPRITAYRWIKRLMAQADIGGARACPKGLRHSYGTRAVLSGVPLHILQRWMGHASMKTTAIYASVIGPDELQLSDQMWGDALCKN